jgi:anti-anti-sigma factor
MTEPELSCHVAVDEAPDSGCCTVQIKDAFLNYALTDELKRDLKDLCRDRMARGVRGFVFDLEPVTVMDSCGLSMLISVKKTIECAGGRMGLASLSPMIARLFEITKLDAAFDIHSDRRTALAALAHA